MHQDEEKEGHDAVQQSLHSVTGVQEEGLTTTTSSTYLLCSDCAALLLLHPCQQLVPFHAFVHLPGIVVFAVFAVVVVAVVVYPGC